jgi:hypothetical protein
MKVLRVPWLPEMVKMLMILLTPMAAVKVVEMVLALRIVSQKRPSPQAMRLWPLIVTALIEVEYLSAGAAGDIFVEEDVKARQANPAPISIFYRTRRR